MGFCYNGFGWGSTWSWWGLIGVILNLVLFVGVLALLGLGTIWLVRRVSHQPATFAVRPDPLEIARRRLAAGEITLAQFEEIRERLQR